MKKQQRKTPKELLTQLSDLGKKWLKDDRTVEAVNRLQSTGTYGYKMPM